MRFMEWLQLTGKILHGNNYHWSLMKKSSISSRQRSTYSQILYCVLERWNNTLNQILLGKTDWRGSKVHQFSGLWTELMVNRWSSSGIFPRTYHIAALPQSPGITVKIERNTREFFTGRIIFMSMFNDILWGSKDDNKECEANAQIVSLYSKKFGEGQWSFLGPGSEKKWYCISEDSPQGEWDKIAELMILKIGESGHPIFPCHKSIIQRSAQKQRRWKIVDPLLCQPGHDYNCFSHNYFCKSALSFRSSRRNVWRVWSLSQ